MDDAPAAAEGCKRLEILRERDHAPSICARRLVG